jgi:hypothetical protein
MARTSNSGELSASIKAMASSVPGSVSKITFLAAADAGVENATMMNNEKSKAMQDFWCCAK